MELTGRALGEVSFTPGKEKESSDRAWVVIGVNYPGDSQVTAIPVVAFGAYARVLRDYSKVGKTLSFGGDFQTRPKKRPDGSIDNYFEMRANWIGLGPDSKKNSAGVAAQASQQTEVLSALEDLLKRAKAAAAQSEQSTSSHDDPFEV
jgi:single-stranded DNA-binding protein